MSRVLMLTRCGARVRTRCDAGRAAAHRVASHRLRGRAPDHRRQLADHRIGAFIVQDGKITSIGARGSVTVPTGATRVSLAGKTVMPAHGERARAHRLRGLHQLGREELHARERAGPLADARRSTAWPPRSRSAAARRMRPSQFVRDQQAGKFAAASRFFFMPGMAPPNGGPDAILIKATNELKAVYEVTTGAQARAAVQGMAAKGLKSVKIWVDDRRGTYPKMTPEVYNAVIDEAHKQRDARARPRDRDGRPEGSGPRRRRRARAHGAERTARRGTARAAA